MIRKIKVHTVKFGQIVKQFATKKQAAEAVELLNHFGIEAEQTVETVEVKIQL